MNKDLNKLVDAVLEWWEEHQYDCESNGEDEYNVYDEEPKFVRIANMIKGYLK